MTFLLYGAAGYTGSLIAERCAQRKIDVVLAGRSDSVRSLGDRLGLRSLVVPLDDANALDRALVDVTAVLHCAGPFSRTSRPMVDACLRTGRHYLDITGEIDVFEACAARSSEAKAANIALLPGVGFDVVPSDCLAAHVKRRLPSATSLSLCIAALGRLSHGTASTVVEHLGEGGAVRERGRIVVEPAGKRSRTFDLGDGKTRLAVSMPWGDVATAWHSTNIDEIVVYFALPSPLRRGARLLPLAAPLLRSRRLRSLVQSFIPSGGPDANARDRGRAVIVAEASDGSRTVTSRLGTPDGYALTVESALLAVSRTVEGSLASGYLTPSLAFGPDFVMQIQGVSRFDTETI
jgi:short subunit dehydrogenase-like uncharacterized protein